MFCCWYAVLLCGRYVEPVCCTSGAPLLGYPRNTSFNSVVEDGAETLEYVCHRSLGGASGGKKFALYSCVCVHGSSRSNGSLSGVLGGGIYVGCCCSGVVGGEVCTDVSGVIDLSCAP